MPDVSMCDNKNCPSRESCYRFTATPNPHRQAYGDFQIKPQELKCKSFINNKLKL